VTTPEQTIAEAGPIADREHSTRSVIPARTTRVGSEGPPATVTAPTVRVIPAGELDERECQRWRELQDADPALASPFFSPEFARCASAGASNMFVAVLEADDRQVGFFPFERSGRSGYPLGRRYAFHQGIVMEPGIELDPVQLVRACGLTEWRFSHLLASQAAFASFHRIHGGSAFIDLSDGLEAYLAARKQTHAKQFSELARKGRKLEREVGPLRFDARTDDPGVFEEIIRLKSDQYARTHGRNLLAIDAYRELLQRMVNSDTPRCAGVVSALYAGDRLVGGSIGVRSRTVFVGIITVYDHEFARYSPGGVLLLRMCDALSASGIATVDLGGSEHAYKLAWSSGETALAEGFIATNHLGRAKLACTAAGRKQTFQVLNHGALGPDRRLGQALRSLRDYGATGARR
jgi:CelD/BcsL family acetyltransferase involved in cellulose biosynthesis